MLVGVVMGSQSDWETMKGATEVLDMLAIPYEAKVISAHRTPDLMFQYAERAEGRLDAIIAGAGGAAHLPGMLASKTQVPVYGVPVQSKTFNGLDSLLSIIQMPFGVGVATFAVGYAGARNAALHVGQWLSRLDDRIAVKLRNFRADQVEQVLRTKLEHPPHKS